MTQTSHSKLDKLDKELPLRPSVVVPPSPLHIYLPLRYAPVVPNVPCKRTNAEGERSAGGGKFKSLSNLDMAPSHLGTLKINFKKFNFDFFLNFF